MLGREKLRTKVLALGLVLEAVAAAGCANGIVLVSPDEGTPAYLSATQFPSTPVKVTGVAICDPTTQLRFGEDTTAPSNPIDQCIGNHEEADAKVQRFSQSGKLTLTTGAGATYPSPRTFKVHTMRNKNGYKFANVAGHPQLSPGDYAELFGPEQFMVQVDFCAPFGGHCPIPTGIPDPVAFIFAAATQASLNGNGDCFGLIMSSQRLMTGEVPFARFDGSVSDVWSLDLSNGPTLPGLQHFVDLSHLSQMSGEYLHAYIGQAIINGTSATAFQDVRNSITASLRANPPDYPMIALASGGDGHLVLAYDIVAGTPDNGGFGNGDYFIQVYDSNQPFLASEDAQGNWMTHLQHEGGGRPYAQGPGGDIGVGRIWVMNDNTWQFFGNFNGNTNWTGGMSSLVQVSHSVVPLNHPTMPALSDLLGSLIFANGAARTTQVYDSAGNTLLTAKGTVNRATGKSIAQAAVLPLIAGAPQKSGAEPFYLFGKPGLYKHQIHAAGDGGAYQDSAFAKGFSTVMNSVTHTADADDQATFNGPSKSFLFASGGAQKPLSVQLAARADAPATHVGLLQTTSFKGGSEQVSFDAGAQTLRFSHLGPSTAATTYSFTLGAVNKGGGVATFASPRDLAVAPGDSVTISASDWTRLDRASVSVTTTHASGAQETRTLTQPAPVTVISGPSADGIVTFSMNAAPLSTAPLTTVEAACIVSDGTTWVSTGKFSGAPGPQTLTGSFNVHSKNCPQAASGAPLTFVVRAVDAAGGVPMALPVTVTAR